MAESSVFKIQSVEPCAQLFATRFSGASLSEHDAVETATAALYVIDSVDSLFKEFLAWDSVVVPFGEVLHQFAEVRKVPGAKL